MQQLNGLHKETPEKETAPDAGVSASGAAELPSELLKELKAPLPAEAVSPNPERPGLSAIKVIYVVERLNEVFDLNGWRVQNQVVENGRMVVVKATLTVPKYGISIEQFGGNDNPDRGDAYKGACTDALSKCASYLGIGMDVYKGLHDPRLRNDSDPRAQSSQRPRSVQNRTSRAAAGLTAGNMGGRFTAMQRVLGEEFYGATLKRFGYANVTDIPNVEKAREVYRLLLDAFRSRFSDYRRAVGPAVYEAILRNMRFNRRAKLSPEQAVRVFNEMEETILAAQ